MAVCYAESDYLDRSEYANDLKVTQSVSAKEQQQAAVIQPLVSSTATVVVEANHAIRETVAASSAGVVKPKSKKKFTLSQLFAKKTANVERSGVGVAPIRKKGKNYGEVAIAEWKKEESYFQSLSQQSAKYIDGPRGMLSMEASLAMKNAAKTDMEPEKEKITKQQEKKITVKILKVLQAVSDGKLSDTFTVAEVSAISRESVFRKKLLKNLESGAKLSWWKILIRRISKRNYYRNEKKNISILQRKIKDLDYILLTLAEEEQQQEMEFLSTTLEKLNGSYEKQLTEESDISDSEDDDRSEAIMKLLLRYGLKDESAEKPDVVRPVSAVSRGGARTRDSDFYSSTSGATSDDEDDMLSNGRNGKKKDEKIEKKDDDVDSSQESKSESPVSDPGTTQKKKKKKKVKSPKKKRQEKIKKRKEKKRRNRNSNDSEEASSEESGEEESDSSSEEQFDLSSCEPTAVGDEYSNTAYTNLEAQHYLKIFDIVQKSGRFFGVLPSLHPEGGFICAYNLETVQKERKLTVKEAKQEITCDGYSWINDGRTMLQKAKQTGVYRTQWRGMNSNKTAVDFKKWLVDSVNHPHIYLLHYFGDPTLCAKGVIHGNAKFTNKKFHAIVPSSRRRAEILSKTMKPKKVYSIMQYEKHDGPAPLFRVRNLNQTQYAAKRGRLQDLCTPNALFNAMLLAQYATYDTANEDEKYFIVDGCFFGPSFRIEMHICPMIKELHQVAKLTEQTQLLYWDTTFLCGDFYVSFLSWMHPLYKKIVLLGAMIHTDREGPNHQKFMDTFYAKHKNRLKKHRFVFITDNEFNFNRLWPNATQLYCSLHLYQNFEKALHDAGVPVDERQQLLRKFMNLRDCNTFDEFDQMKEDIYEKNEFADDRQKNLFTTYINKLRNESSAAAYLASKKFDKEAVQKFEEALNSNPAESLNALFKEHIDKRELSIDELAFAVFYFGGVFCNDVLRGYYNDGNFELIKEYRSQVKGDAFDLPQELLLSLPNFADFNKWILQQEGPIFEGEQNIDVRKALLVTAVDNFEIFQLKDNVYTIIDSITQRKATVTLASNVRKDECTCGRRATCLHILAARKQKGDELVGNDVVGNPLKDEKRQRNKKLGRHGRKRRVRNKNVNADDSPFVSDSDILSPIQKVIKKENDQEHSREIRGIRNYIKERVLEFYSPSHRPCKLYPLDDHTWFSAINSNFSAISSSIYKGSFVEPLPTVNVKESVFAATSDNILLFIYRNESNKITATAIGDQFSNNAIDECIMHSAMVARDQKNDVAVKLYLYNNCNDSKKKLVLLSLFNQMFNNNSSSIPSRFDNMVPPDTVTSAYVESLMKLNGDKLATRRRTVPLLCCCLKPCFTLSEERNTILQNDPMTQCSGCNNWFFFKCGAVATASNEQWFCWDCKLSFPPMVDHCNLHDCKYTNSCPIDGVLSACYVFNKNNNNILSKAIDRYDLKNVFEDSLQTFMASDIMTQSDMKSAKHTFLKRVYKKQYDLEGFEETIVLQNFKERYLAYGDFFCQTCSEGGTTVAEDYLFFNSINQNVATTITECLQPETFDIRKWCCNSRLDISNKRYRFPIPWVLPLRPLEFPFLRQFTPEKLEEIPFMVDVLNGTEVINYKIAYISFSTPGHFVGMIPSKNGWIYYNGLREPAMLPLRQCIQKITAEGGTLNALYYFVNSLPKTSQKRSAV